MHKTTESLKLVLAFLFNDMLLIVSPFDHPLHERSSILTTGITACLPFAAWGIASHLLTLQPLLSLTA
jgi:hypothetical protein